MSPTVDLAELRALAEAVKDAAEKIDGLYRLPPDLFMSAREEVLGIEAAFRKATGPWTVLALLDVAEAAQRWKTAKEVSREAFSRGEHLTGQSYATRAVHLERALAASLEVLGEQSP